MIIFSWNTDSLRSEKWNKLKSFLNDNNPDIVCINETKSKEDVLISLFEKEIPNYNYVINTRLL